MTNAAVPAVPVPANLIARDDKSKILDDQYLIFAETGYLYQPAVGYVMKAGVPLSDKSYMRPRLLNCVYYSPEIVCPKKLK